MISDTHQGPILRNLRRAVVAASLLALVATGCGADVPDVGATAPPTSTTTAPPPAPGAVTLELSGVSDSTGLVMVSLIGKNLPSQPIAAVCSVVQADDFSFTGQYLPISGPDPCSLGSDPVELQPGSYDVIVAVMPGGSTTPDRCAQTEVEVDGESTITVAALGPATDCGF